MARAGPRKAGQPADKANSPYFNIGRAALINSRLLRVVLAVAVVGLATAVAFGQEVGYLDLTGPAPHQRVRSPSGGTGGFCGGTEFPKFPEVTLILVSLDKTVYSIGEDVTFEVRIENSGQQNIELPWTPDLATLEPNDATETYTYLNGVVVLNLTEPDSQRYFSVYGYFYGSDRASGTIHKLRPRESVVIRARTKLDFYDEWWAKKVREVQPLHVRAEPGFMMNSATYVPNEKGDSGSESMTCIPLARKTANQIDVLVWAHYN